MTDWRDCYIVGWQGAIIPEAFAHPAKMARALLRRILAHALAEGWVSPGDHVLDPFGGIGATGIEGAYVGLRVTCVELEPKFVDLARQNFALHRGAWQTLGVPEPVMIRGDSRRLADLVARADCCIGSPPFIGAQQIDDRKAPVLIHGSRWKKRQGEMKVGSSPGQLGAMPEGRFDACVGSPPYEGSLDARGDGIDWTRAQRGGHSKVSGTPRGAARGAIADGYGAGENNLGNSSGDTFWSASRTILEQCHTVLRPGGHVMWVCKDFVRRGQRVPFSDQWAAICEATGFRLVCRHRAMLVERKGVQVGMFGQHKVIGTARKSFFRILAERKGSPAIDWEDVLCFERP